MVWGLGVKKGHTAMSWGETLMPWGATLAPMGLTRMALGWISISLGTTATPATVEVKIRGCTAIRALLTLTPDAELDTKHGAYETTCNRSHKHWGFSIESIYDNFLSLESILAILAYRSC